jgi:hypothetical protein
MLLLRRGVLQPHHPPLNSPGAPARTRKRPHRGVSPTCCGLQLLRTTFSYEYMRDRGCTVLRVVPAAFGTLLRIDVCKTAAMELRIDDFVIMQCIADLRRVSQAPAQRKALTTSC